MDFQLTGKKGHPIALQAAWKKDPFGNFQSAQEKGHPHGPPALLEEGAPHGHPACTEERAPHGPPAHRKRGTPWTPPTHLVERAPWGLPTCSGQRTPPVLSAHRTRGTPRTSRYIHQRPPVPRRHCTLLAFTSLLEKNPKLNPKFLCGRPPLPRVSWLGGARDGGCQRGTPMG